MPAPVTAEDVARYNLRVLTPKVDQVLSDLYATVAEARRRDRRPMPHEMRMILQLAADLMITVTAVETLEGVLPAVPTPETHT
jgi:hypothetical protein